MKQLFYLVLLCFCISTTVGQVKELYAPLELYGGEFTLLNIYNMDGYYIDLNCTGQDRVTITFFANIPEFQQQISAITAYVSHGPATGRHSPYPDPDDTTSYTYTTYQRGQFPLPNITFNNMDTSKGLYVTVGCGFYGGTNCRYNVAFTYHGKDTKMKQTGLVKDPVPHLTSSYALKKRQTINFQVRNLFARNKVETSGEVAYQEFITYELPVCKSALARVFGGDGMVCLETTIVGKSLQYLFYQQLNENRTTSPDPALKWQTRPQSFGSPLLDLSGNVLSPINRFRSKPTKVKDVPPVLWHAVEGNGGEVSLGHMNYFFSYAEWVGPCTA